MIIDCGHHDFCNWLLTTSQNFNIDITTVKQILLTHTHPDHIGAAAALKAYTGASLKGFKPEVNKKLTDSLKKDLNLLTPPLCLDEYLEDGSIIDTGADSIEVVYTPGHAEDHVCYFLKSKKILFTGDLITDSDIGYLNPNRHYSESLKKLENSIQICEKLKPDILLPGHGNVIPVTASLWRSVYRKIWLFNKNPSLIIPHTLISTLIFYLLTKKAVNPDELEEFIVSYSELFDGFIENTSKDLIRSEYRKLIAVLILKDIIIKSGEMISLNKFRTSTESLWIM